MEQFEKEYFELSIKIAFEEIIIPDEYDSFVNNGNFDRLINRHINSKLIKDSFLRKYTQFIDENDFLMKTKEMQRVFGDLVIERLYKDIQDNIKMTKHLFDCMKRTTNIDAIIEYLTSKVKQFNIILESEDYDKELKTNVKFIDTLILKNIIKTKIDITSETLKKITVGDRFIKHRLPDKHNIEPYRIVFRKNDKYREEYRKNNWRTICFNIARKQLELKEETEHNNFYKAFNKWKKANKINNLEEFEKFMSTYR